MWLMRIEPATIVADAHPQVIAVGGDPYLNMFGASVADAIRRCLLDDAVHARAMFVRQSIEVAFGLEIYVDRVAAHTIAGMPFERRLQAEVIEHAGAQSERQVADGPEHVVDERAAFGNHRRDARAEALHASEFHAQSSQHLRDMVVQLA